MDNLPIYLAAGATFVAAGWFCVQSLRMKKEAAKLDRALAFYEDIAREILSLEAGERLPASRRYTMCGGCGASVEVEEDGFTPRWHKCFDPAATAYQNRGVEIDGPFGVDIQPQYKGRKIPIGLKGHLHTLK